MTVAAKQVHPNPIVDAALQGDRQVLPQLALLPYNRPVGTPLMKYEPVPSNYIFDSRIWTHIDSGVEDVDLDNVVSGLHLFFNATSYPASFKQTSTGEFSG